MAENDGTDEGTIPLGTASRKAESAGKDPGNSAADESGSSAEAGPADAATGVEPGKPAESDSSGGDLPGSGASESDPSASDASRSDAAGGEGELESAPAPLRGRPSGAFDAASVEQPSGASGSKGGDGGPTGIVLMNLGGPIDLDGVQPFLLQLFADREIIKLPFQNWLGPFIARRRTGSVQANYRMIGGGSPILEWTRKQGQGMCERLDRLRPQSAPHRFYVAFRYAPPTSEDALVAMQQDGVRRAVAFTQYPQFSCSTTGSSLNELWRAAGRTDLRDAFDWSVIDRWHVHPGFIAAMTETVREGLTKFSDEDRDDALLVFSAHSLPLSVVDRGDAYIQECAASVQAVMHELGHSHEYLLSWQSEVGPVRWMGPSTEKVLHELGRKKRRNVLVVPIAFTSDHIETLHELDIEYGELAKEVGIENYHRAPAMNDSPLFLDAMADIVAAHLDRGEPCTRQYGLRCPGCVNPQCRNILNPVAPYRRTRVGGKEG